MTSKSLCVGLVAAMFLATACSSSDDTSSASVSEADKAAAVQNYAALVKANYDDSLAQAKKVQAAIDAFLADTTEANFEAAKAAWVAARPSYLETEAFRFYNGPIDNAETGPEGAINAWPIDENYIDYVEGNPTAGIINMPDQFPDITEQVIADANNATGRDEDVSTGWHAIEFLLWGQDQSTTGPGARPYTDYLTEGGTAANQDRRRTYLKLVTDLLVADLESVAVQWDTSNASSYGATFVAGSPDTAIGDILKGIGSLAATELPKERMNNAYETKEQEEEHSCFSDTTNQDLDHNAKGIQNVYLGTYGSVSGTSISSLVAKVNPELDAKTRADIEAALAATAAIPKPFDQAILGDDSSDGRVKLKAAIDSWVPVAEDIVEVATALGVTINLSEE